MLLWTWQGEIFNPLSDRVDRKKSRFYDPTVCKTIQQAYHELDELLARPGQQHQYLWCLTDRKEARERWNKRLLWTIEVPDENVLGFIDDRLWNHLIGSEYVPQILLEEWSEALLNLEGTAYEQAMDRRSRDYHESFPSRVVCLEQLLTSGQPGPGVSALITAPIEIDWLRPSDYAPQSI
jgi:hypothetical protein